jgi:hypothetical protein
LLYEAVHAREAEAAALAALLAREKWLKDVRNIRRVDAASRISHAENGAWTRKIPAHAALDAEADV